MLPRLVSLGLIHYQFEAIHPFLDGNGRIGRLLITLLLCVWDLLPQPLLYLSAYFEAHRQAYYDLLLVVSQRGEWEDWLIYFLHGVALQSRDAVVRIGRLRACKGDTGSSSGDPGFRRASCRQWICCSPNQY
jgi:Fic family protein